MISIAVSVPSERLVPPQHASSRQIPPPLVIAAALGPELPIHATPASARLILQLKLMHIRCQPQHRAPRQGGSPWVLATDAEAELLARVAGSVGQTHQSPGESRTM